MSETQNQNGEIEYYDPEAVKQYEVTVKFISEDIESALPNIVDAFSANAIEVARIVEVHDPVRLKHLLIQRDLLPPEPVTANVGQFPTTPNEGEPDGDS